VRTAGIVSGTEFHGTDVVALQLLENIIDGQLRQQGCEYADSHGVLLKVLVRNQQQNITRSAAALRAM
jgi:hypothetical protein